MKNRKLDSLYKLTLLLFLILILGMLIFFRGRSSYDVSVYSEKYVSNEEVKSQLSFTVYSQDEWTQFFSGRRKGYLTGETLSLLLEKLGVDGHVEWEEKSGKKAVLRSEWNEVYQKLLDFLDYEKKVTKETVLILDRMESEQENVLFTNKEDIYTSLPLSLFDQWEACELYLFDGACIGIAKISEEACRIENVYLNKKQEERIGFLYDGGEYELAAGDIEVELTEGVCDFVLKNGKLVQIFRKMDSIQGKLLSYDSEYIEIENYGKIKHTKNLPVYQTFGEITEKSVSDVVLGNMEAEYIVGGDEVCALLIKTPPEIARVRVLLLSSEGTRFRGNVWFRCDENAIFSNGSETQTLSAGAVICAGDYVSDRETTFRIKPETENGLIYLCNEAGEAVSNGYSGTMEVRRYEEGCTVVNDVSLETYLYSVVPSEMPSSYETEALKAQAVCARSYAYIQILRADLKEYGAHINDSTSYQVYNKSAKTEASVNAVNQTAGLIMTYQGNVIEAYYFSTSMGYTDTARVWNVELSDANGYLKSVCLNKEPYAGNLSEEASFKEYLHADVTGYDSDIMFYRWQGNADFREKTEAVKEILRARRQVSEKSILYFGADNETAVDNCDDFGKLITVSVKERSEAGSILALHLAFEYGNAEVRSEYNIRSVLGCGLKTLKFMNGEEREMTLLPSAFCTVEALGDGTYLLDGGGYGHGIGMSQNGANGLAKEGYSYDNILRYFYNDIELETLHIEEQ